MASMRDIKRRKVSIQSTQQITKAMKLVSTVRLQRAKAKAERSRAYFKCMQKTVASMLSRTGNVNHPYLSSKGDGRKAVVVISSNRGLAGGFNSNVVRLMIKNDQTADWDPASVDIYAIGNKAKDGLARAGFGIADSDPDAIDEPVYDDAKRISDKLLEKFRAGEISEIYVAYTEFKNTVTHIPTLIRVLPVELPEDEADGAGVSAPMNFEPAEDESLDLIVPKYVASMIYGALMQSIASENGARMQAMDSATSNAEDMIQSLALQYNRARQSSITQELTEIIAGAEAIS
ncbi:MAG: ATP synthase F1 subunit gamma [Lachnospiraceae bacterium]|nr:ATP synthase F1 subunit gamma [Lachnospiraceae bacterium]